MSFRTQWVRLRALVGRRRLESDLDDEIRFHLSEDAEEHVAGGLSVEDARTRARREFGNVTLVRERTRDEWIWGALERLGQDIRYGARTLRGAPIVSGIAILSLALGIGANTAIFSVLDTLVLRSLPVKDPDRLMIVADERSANIAWTNPIWEQIRAHAGIFDGAFAVSSTRFNMAERGESEFVDGLRASGAMFEVLGVHAVLGRTFSDADDRPGGGLDGPVAVISHAYWQRRFGGARDIIGRSLTIDRVPFTIVGVTPPEFFGVEVGRRFDIAIPIGTLTLMRGPGALQMRTQWWLRVVIRLAPNQTAVEATAALRAVQPAIRAATLPPNWRPGNGATFLGSPFRLEPASNGDSQLRQSYRQPLVLIMSVVGLVLLIACANLANLLLARAAARQHELSLRLALGASRWRIARQLFVESMLLAATGAALGLLLARWGSDLLVRQLSTATNTVFLNLAIDWRILLFTGVVTMATALLFGTLPAVRGTRVAPNDALKAHGRSAGAGGTGRLGHVLVVVQVALSLVLLVGAGLFLRTFSSLARLDRGFDGSAVMVTAIEMPSPPIAAAERRAIVDGVLAAAASVPGVASAAISELTPLGNNTWNNPIELPDGPQLSAEERLTYFNMISLGWFSTYSTPLLGGRDFTAADTVAAPPVGIVNEAFARRFTGGRSPLGTRVKAQGATLTIVGIVRDAVYESLRAPAPPTLYLSLAQQRVLPGSTVLSVRALGGNPSQLIKPLSVAISGVDRDLRMTFRPVSDQVSAAMRQERIVAALSAAFGALGLLLAGIGLYGVTAYNVSLRRTEIGVRMALGAATRQVLSQIVTDAMRLVALGLVAGGLAAMLVGRLASPQLSRLLFRTTAWDPATIAAAAAVLTCVALVAAYIPARRAAGVDPMIALRNN